MNLLLCLQLFEDKKVRTVWDFENWKPIEEEK